MTIEVAIRQIVNRRYLLPAIQKKFTWNSSQICVLFDSIMRGYPINTFMFWKVQNLDVKRSFRFYQFLERYCERFEENAQYFDTKGHGDFFAVIDGQQRLTSLYIGLKGTYADKLPQNGSLEPMTIASFRRARSTSTSQILSIKNRTRR